MKDLVGKVFERLIVVEKSDDRNQETYFLCLCTCGNTKIIRGHSLTGGSTKSCGCLQKERASEANITHGLTPRGKHHPLYKRWQNMKARCNNPTNNRYEIYGKVGIKVCEEWDTSFLNFYNWAMEKYPNLDELLLEKYQIDRFPNKKGNYEPGNCRIVSVKDNQRNKNNNHLVTYQGKEYVLVELAEEIGMPYKTLHGRLVYWNNDVERAVNTPIRKSSRYN